MIKKNKILFIHKKKQYVNIITLSLLFFFILFNFNSYAQKRIASNNEIVMQNSDLNKITEANYGNGWIDYKKNQQVDPNNFFKTFNKAFNLGINDEMKLHKTLEDNYGNTHYKYLQYYKGIEVEGSEYIIHMQGNNIISSNGTIINNINLEVNPLITKEFALGNCKSDNKVNVELESGQLLITKKSNLYKFDGSNFILAYKFISKSDLNSSYIYIDANNGEFIKSISNSKSMVCTGSCQLDYYGGITRNDFQTTRTGVLGFYKYWTREENKNILVEDADNLPGLQYSDNDNDWTSETERPTVTALWSTERVWEYFYWSLGRSGMDNNTNKIWIKLNTGLTNEIKYDSWPDSYDYIKIGSAQNIGEFVSLDAIGHEFGHGVSVYSLTNPFNDSGEAKNLEEGICDIFGAAAENYVFPSSNNYLIGEQEFSHTWVSPYYLRSMSNPHTTNTAYQPAQAEYYLEPGYWCDPNYFSCDARVNSGVINKWFWLLSNGGTFRGITVLPIGINNGAYIVYYALIHYLTGYSNFGDMKNATIHSAMAIYGSCSQEAQSVYDAWMAVNVLANSPILTSSVNCTSLTVAHSNGLQYSAGSVGTFNINCNIANGNVTSIKASDKIIISQGFSSGTGAGTNFHAFIEPCDGTFKKINNLSAQNNEQENIEKILQENSKKTQENYFRIYPNPNNGVFSIYKFGSSEALSKIEVSDLLGNKIYQSEMNNDQSTIDISSYPKGMYIVRINSGSELFVEKIIVQ